MHIVDFQYLEEITTNLKDTRMHDLASIYRKVRKTVKRSLKQYLVDGGNLRFYPNPPKMNDIEVISLAITAECLGIDSENLLFSKLKKDYKKMFPNLGHRTKYNIRRKNLQEWILLCADIWGEDMDQGEDTFIIDSIPVPVCKICRGPRSTVCRKDSDEVQAAHGRDSSINQYYVGYRLHLIVSESGIYQHRSLLPANVHDIVYLKSLEETHLSECTLIGDKAYRSEPLQLRLFEDWHIDLSVPFRENQKDYQEYPYEKKIKRKRIETVFSQYCDEFMLKRNYAKSYLGILSRIDTKIAAMTFKQNLNFKNGKKISQTKHSLAA